MNIHTLYDNIESTDLQKRKAISNILLTDGEGVELNKFLLLPAPFQNVFFYVKFVCFCGYT